MIQGMTHPHAGYTPLIVDAWQWHTSRSRWVTPTKKDSVEFLKLGAEIPIYSTVNLYALKDVIQAVKGLKDNQFNGEAVLRVSDK